MFIPEPEWEEVHHWRCLIRRPLRVLLPKGTVLRVSCGMMVDRSNHGSGSRGVMMEVDWGPGTRSGSIVTKITTMTQNELPPAGPLFDVELMDPHWHPG
ncbi:MAG: hypothetical protein Ct9H300mP11_26350 [Chloroflexota bacterium]|nr:MAG: hypothetical protein Ct9H300mP11_26350 [Chloroflexota bacterium]